MAAGSKRGAATGRRKLLTLYKLPGETAYAFELAPGVNRLEALAELLAALSVATAELEAFLRRFLQATPEVPEQEPVN